MTREQAIDLVRECAQTDFVGATGGTTDDPERAIQMWVEVSEDIEDMGTLAAIDMLGRDTAARVYRDRIAELKE